LSLFYLQKIKLRKPVSNKNIERIRKKLMEQVWIFVGYFGAYFWFIHFFCQGININLSLWWQSVQNKIYTKISKAVTKKYVFKKSNLLKNISQFLQERLNFLKHFFKGPIQRHATPKVVIEVFSTSCPIQCSMKNSYGFFPN